MYIQLVSPSKQQRNIVQLCTNVYCTVTGLERSAKYALEGYTLERYIRWRDITWRDIPGHILYLTYFAYSAYSTYFAYYTRFLYSAYYFLSFCIFRIFWGGGVMVPKKVIQLTRHFEPSLSSIPKNLKQKFKCHSSSPMD